MGGHLFAYCVPWEFPCKQNQVALSAAMPWFGACICKLERPHRDSLQGILHKACISLLCLKFGLVQCTLIQGTVTRYMHHRNSCSIHLQMGSPPEGHRSVVLHNQIPEALGASGAWPSGPRVPGTCVDCTQGGCPGYYALVMPLFGATI